LQQDVGVGVDQAGEDGAIGEVDDRNVGSLRAHVGPRPDRHDALILDQDPLVGAGLVGDAVDQATGVHQHCWRHGTHRTELCGEKRRREHARAQQMTEHQMPRRM